MKILKFVADNIKDRMKEQEITPYQLSDMTGIDKFEIYKILGGKKNITLKTLFKLTEALKVDKLSL